MKFFAGAFAAIAAIAAVAVATTGNMSSDKSATENRSFKAKAVSENRSFKTASGPGVPSKNRSFKTQKVRGHGSQNLCPFVHLPCFYSTRTHSQNSANPYPPLARGFAHS